MNVLYLHGWGSKYDPESDKVQALRELGEVHGVDLDYTQGFEPVLVAALKVFLEKKIDIVVGTSMGGFLASHVGCQAGIPFVACNPALFPKQQLSKYLGHGTTYDGREYEFTEQALEGYPAFAGLGPEDQKFNDEFKKGLGMIGVDLGDELIDSQETARIATQNETYPVMWFADGCHRFAHMTEMVGITKKYLRVNK
jgi:predicted esterase YcpF (UPF0227 family)